MVAPYQIALHDGRLIFAPQDSDQVIRLRPTPAPDAPSSPEYVPSAEGEGGYGDDEEDEVRGILSCCFLFFALLYLSPSLSISLAHPSL